MKEETEIILKVINYGLRMVACLFMGFAVSIFLTFIFIGIYSFVKMIISSSQSGFSIEKNKRFKLTELGKAELKKIFAFKSFIENFGLFASKNPEEIVLWDYYLSYAQVFGLTDKILKTGYKKIIKNGSFEINDIDSIDLSKININDNSY